MDHIFCIHNTSYHKIASKYKILHKKNILAQKNIILILLKKVTFDHEEYDP